MGERRMEKSGSHGRFKRLAGTQAAALILTAFVLLLVTAGALALTGDLTQPTGTAGCISESGAPCADGHGLFDAYSLAVSPDGKSVYVAARSGNTVALLNRNTTSGAVTQPTGTTGCVSETGAGSCADGHALSGASSVAVSPDGKSVYVASTFSNAVTRFNRNTTTGVLTQPTGTAGCISEDGAGPCADGHGLSEAYSVAVSPDGKSVYVASTGTDAVVRLTRNTTSGAITQPAGTAGCISDSGTGPCVNGRALADPHSVAVSADGKNVYVASAFSDSVVRLNRNTTSGAISQPAGTAGCVSETGSGGTCADGHGLNSAYGLAVSADGKSVYVASFLSNSVARLSRNTTSGAITQPAGTAGCISETGAGACADGHALKGSWSVAASPDGKNAYVASYGSNAVARLNRNTTSGAITQPAGAAGCISEDGTGPCADGQAISGPLSVVVSPDAKSVYAAANGVSAVSRFNRTP